MIEITETCADCKYCVKLYVPPCKCFKDIPKDAYVCSLFLKEANRVQWLGDNRGFCEMFTQNVEQEVKRLYKAGVKVTDIVEMTNYSKSVVYRMIHKGEKDHER